MSLYLSLNKQASQSFDVNINNNNYEFKIFFDGTGMKLDLYINTEPVSLALPLLEEQLLIVHKNQEVDGNFVFVTNSGEDPDYAKFDESQFLFYLDAETAAEYRSLIS